jgi:hypothetical protein
MGGQTASTVPQICFAQVGGARSEVVAERPVKTASIRVDSSAQLMLTKNGASHANAPRASDVLLPCVQMCS